MNKFSKSFAVAAFLGISTQACIAEANKEDQASTPDCPKLSCAYVNSVDKVDATLLPDLCATNKSAIYKCLWKGNSTHQCLNDTVTTLKCDDTLLSTEINAKNYQGYQGLCAQKANIQCLSDSPTGI